MCKTECIIIQYDVTTQLSDFDVWLCGCVYVCVSQVGQAKDSSLTNQLIDYLMGESDGMPKVIDTLQPSLLPLSQWM